MNIQEWLDDIEDEIRIAGIQMDCNRWDLLNWASAELNALSGEFDHDCFLIHLNPAVKCVSGTRNYDLPHNFGLNFAPAGGDQGESYCCTLDNDSSEAPLEYVTATRFYSQNLVGQSDGTPSKYTIITMPGGQKQIALSPAPNDDFEVNGLYKPTDWDLKTMDDIPPLPANSPILKYAVLMRINKERWANDYMHARSSLVMEFARSRKVKFVPNYSGHRNSYSLMR